MRVFMIIGQFALSLLNAILFTDSLLHGSYRTATLQIFAAVFCFVLGVKMLFDDVA
jgi:hypothetical protein